MDSDGFATKMTDNATLITGTGQNELPYGGDDGHGGERRLSLLMKGQPVWK